MGRPGLSGIGSIVFRNEEEILEEASNSHAYYKGTLAPYKALLEIWYIERRRILDYFVLILITVLVVISSRSSIIWSIYNDLPVPPRNLKRVIGYND